MGANVMMGLCRVVGGCVEFVGPTIHRQAVVVQLFIAKRCRVARFCVEVEMAYVADCFVSGGTQLGIFIPAMCRRIMVMQVTGGHARPEGP